MNIHYYSSLNEETMAKQKPKIKPKLTLPELIQKVDFLVNNDDMK